MKLYICFGTFRTPRPGGHPCRNAARALGRAGHAPELICVGGLPVGPATVTTRGRADVERLSGNRWVPTLVLDDGTVIDGSARIVAWAATHPADRPAT